MFSETLLLRIFTTISIGGRTVEVRSGEGEENQFYDQIMPIEFVLLRGRESNSTLPGISLR